MKDAQLIHDQFVLANNHFQAFDITAIQHDLELTDSIITHQFNIDKSS